MPFIVNKHGERINVEVETDWFSEQCALYADNAELKEVFLLNLYINHNDYDKHKEPELIKQIIYKDNKPSPEQIMYHMRVNGLSRSDIATIEQDYILDWE